MKHSAFNMIQKLSVKVMEWKSKNSSQANIKISTSTKILFMNCHIFVMCQPKWMKLWQIIGKCSTFKMHVWMHRCRHWLLRCGSCPRTYLSHCVYRTFALLLYKSDELTKRISPSFFIDTPFFHLNKKLFYYLKLFCDSAEFITEYDGSKRKFVFLSLCCASFLQQLS